MKLKKLLIEAFLSSTLAKYVEQLRKLEKGNVLPTGIQWDKIPESAVDLDEAGTDTIKKYVNSDKYLILWFSSQKQVAKYRYPLHSKYGTLDRSSYLTPGKVLITRGRNFLYGYNDLLTRKPATDNYERPISGLSVLALSRDLNAMALILDYDVLNQYSSTDIKQQRTSQKQGATALMSASQILDKNQDRYDEIRRKSKAKKITATVDKRVDDAIKKLKEKIEKASSIDFNNLVTFNKQPNKQYDIPELKIDYNLLKNLVNKYKALVDIYESYLNNAYDFASGRTSYEKYMETDETHINRIISEI
jgi:hypothetical protein